MRCPIVLACDGRYAMPLATTLRSAVEAGDGVTPFEFHILVDGVSQNSGKGLAIPFRNAPRRFSGSR